MVQGEPPQVIHPTTGARLSGRDATHVNNRDDGGIHEVIFKCAKDFLDLNLHTDFSSALLNQYLLDSISRVEEIAWNVPPFS